MLWVNEVANSLAGRHCSELALLVPRLEVHVANTVHDAHRLVRPGELDHFAQSGVPWRGILASLGLFAVEPAADLNVTLVAGLGLLALARA